ncbi:MAG: HAAS signaling domain-containing protein [Dehalococcoidia bacterium]
MNQTSDRIDAYLDDLLRELRVDRRRPRRILAETEDHLREAAERGCAQGLSQNEAERRAIDSFGTARTVARRFAAEEGRLLPASLLLHLVLALGLLTSIGFVAVGVSGLAAAGMGTAFGERFVAGDIAGASYTPARCAEFQEYEPRAATCEAAATAHHYGEVVGYRLALGVLGLFGLAGCALIRRRYPRLSGVRMLPDEFSPTVGAALFGVAGVMLLLQGTAQAATENGSGSGAYLSGGIVSAAVFAAYATPLLRRLSRRSVLT